jgi:deoxyribodipyrimidine photo-lyase
MRQVLASFWLYEYAGDWRLGAAWFEHTLLDYDVMSNTGNWLYIAGLGSDPKGGRRFDVAWQARTHDPQGVYTRRWSKEAL